MTDWLPWIILAFLLGALVGAALAWRAARRRSAAEREGLRETFRSLSVEALQSNQQTLLEFARNDLTHRQQAITEVLKPVQETLQKVDGQLRDVEKERATAFATLKEQIGELSKTHQELRDETANLVQALRSPAERGRWGELQLRRML